MIQNSESKSRFLVWLLPLSVALHLLEEYFGGKGLPVWMSDLLNRNITESYFITINSIALFLIIVFSAYHSSVKQNNVLFLGLISLFFINGVLHLAVSIYTVSYSPGTVTGVLIYLPLGIFLYRKIRPSLSNGNRTLGILLGAFIHLIVVLITLNN